MCIIKRKHIISFLVTKETQKKLSPNDITIRITELCDKLGIKLLKLNLDSDYYSLHIKCTKKQLNSLLSDWFTSSLQIFSIF